MIVDDASVLSYYASISLTELLSKYIYVLIMPNTEKWTYIQTLNTNKHSC